VEQVLINVLNNAIKFTERGRVTLSAGTESGRVRLRVTDTGIGIKPQDLATLFQPFRQIDTGLSRQHEGTGLGLAICRRLVTLMGGDITASSEWTRGSEFTVTLPLHPNATP
jgi:signal transduction histidine kinase